jgi:hypothetical protein
LADLIGARADSIALGDGDAESMSSNTFGEF